MNGLILFFLRNWQAVVVGVLTIPVIGVLTLFSVRSTSCL